MYLSRHSIAFREHKEGFNENIRGSFNDLVILLRNGHHLWLFI